MIFTFENQNNFKVNSIHIFHNNILVLNPTFRISKQREAISSSVSFYSTKEAMKESKLDCLEFKKKVSIASSPINQLMFASK